MPGAQGGPMFTNLIIFDCYRMDYIYADKEMNTFSVTKYSDEYERYSERIRRLYPKMVLDDNLVIRPGTSQVVNFKTLRNLLISKDLDADDPNGPNGWMFDGKMRFLDGEDLKSFKTCLPSWPRSGNSMTRKYLETITGIYSGSDMSALVAINLQLNNMPGENVYDDTVWVTKSHYPIAPINEPSHYASKVIVVVRNPLETFASMANLMALGSHSLVCNEKLEEQTWWPLFVEILGKDCADYYNLFTYDYKNKTDNAFHIIRYEDMRRDPFPTFVDLFRFLLEVDSIEGTLCEKTL